MKGLEASVVALRKLPTDLRIDAQFFKKAYLAEDMALLRHRLRDVGTFAFVTDGPHGYHVVDDSSPIAMLTAKCAANWFAEREGADTIATWVDDANKRSSLQVDDLILGTRGTIGACAIVTAETLPANLDQDVARIAIKDEGFEPKFVLAFLNGRFGQDHLIRHATGMVQQGISLAKVRSIPVPVLSDSLQELVSSAVDRALAAWREGKRVRDDAQRVLVSALGLADWHPPEPLTYLARASDAFAAGRLDAQYFRPLFAEVHERLRQTGCGVELGTILTTNARGRQPHYDETGLPVVNSKHVRTNRVVLEDNRTAAEEGSLVVIGNGDVLVNGTGVGTIGRAAAYLHSERALPDNHVTVLRTEQLDPVYLAVFLNSPLGKWQIERHIKGSSGQVELYPNDIARTVVWQAPDDVQSSVRQAIMDAFAQERRAKDLLDAAKRAVEIAIEDNEAAAMAYLTKAEEAA